MFLKFVYFKIIIEKIFFMKDNRYLKERKIKVN